MPDVASNKKTTQRNRIAPIYVEAMMVIIVALFIVILQFGTLEPSNFLSFHAFFTVMASLSVWYINRMVSELILQSRIEANKVTRQLPFELLGASVVVTSVVYILIFLVYSYVEKLEFVLAHFLQGYSMTIGLSLLVVTVYVGGQIWESWWSDEEFLFQPGESIKETTQDKQSIIIKDSRKTTTHELRDIRYFFSESKIVFLVDTNGKKWITQYTLSELESLLDDRFFRLNRSVMVSREIISQIKKLPNHRLLVTIGDSKENHQETISRYRSTRFKHWFYHES